MLLLLVWSRLAKLPVAHVLLVAVEIPVRVVAFCIRSLCSDDAQVQFSVRRLSGSNSSVPLKHKKQDVTRITSTHTDRQCRTRARVSFPLFTYCAQFDWKPCMLAIMSLRLKSAEMDYTWL